MDETVYIKKTKEETILGYYGEKGELESFYVPFLKEPGKGKWSPDVQYYPIRFEDVVDANNITIKTGKVYQNLGEIRLPSNNKNKIWNEYKEVNPIKNRYTILNKSNIYALLIDYFNRNILVDFKDKGIEDKAVWCWWICERLKSNIHDWNVDSWTEDNQHVFFFYISGN